MNGEHLRSAIELLELPTMPARGRDWINGHFGRYWGLRSGFSTMIAKVKHVSAPARQEWSNDRGGVTIELRSPAVVFASLRGHADANMGMELATALDEHLDSPLVRHVFFEAEDLIGYHSNIRTEPTKVLLKHREAHHHPRARSIEARADGPRGRQRRFPG